MNLFEMGQSGSYFTLTQFFLILAGVVQTASGHTTICLQTNFCGDAKFVLLSVTPICTFLTSRVGEGWPQWGGDNDFEIMIWGGLPPLKSLPKVGPTQNIKNKSNDCLAEVGVDFARN